MISTITIYATFTKKKKNLCPNMADYKKSTSFLCFHEHFEQQL